MKLERIIRILSEQEGLTINQIAVKLGLRDHPNSLPNKSMNTLIRSGLVTKKGRLYYLQKDAPQQMPKESSIDTEYINATFAKMLSKNHASIEKAMRHQNKRLEEIEVIAKRSFAELKITTPEGNVVKLKNTTLPVCFAQALDLAKMRKNILLVGPAGCGKTTLGELMAKSLELDFSAISCTAGMNEIHLTGRSTPNLTTGKSNFETTPFLQRYEEGGLFLLDELDAADPNFALCFNTAIANSYCNVPNRPKEAQAKKHGDFVLVATANTFGRGATRMYAGRNQLDEATIDRFRIGLIEMDYDKVIEEVLCPHYGLRETCWAVRENIVKHGLRRIMSTRYMKDAYEMVKGCKWTVEKVMTVFFQGWTPEEREKAWVKPNENRKHKEVEIKEVEEEVQPYKIDADAPQCANGHGQMRRMASGKGWRCAVPDNKYVNGSWTRCNYCKWD